MAEQAEHDKLFEHEYDGIKEYDNPLPRWWVWMFVGSILIAYPYIFYYHFGPGSSVHDALDAEVAAYAEHLMATYGELQPDVPTIVTYMDDPTAMTGMASLFKGKCAQCHLADGSGNVGPNLTDEHWINVKSVTDIPQIITAGVVAKGMPEWGSKLSETQVVLLSSYVAQLSRNPVPGKEPQGDPIEPWPSADEVPPPEEPPAEE